MVMSRPSGLLGFGCGESPLTMTTPPCPRTPGSPSGGGKCARTSRCISRPPWRQEPWWRQCIVSAESLCSTSLLPLAARSAGALAGFCDRKTSLWRYMDVRGHIRIDIQIYMCGWLLFGVYINKDLQIELRAYYEASPGLLVVVGSSRACLPLHTWVDCDANQASL